MEERRIEELYAEFNNQDEEGREHTDDEAGSSDDEMKDNDIRAWIKTHAPFSRRKGEPVPEDAVVRAQKPEKRVKVEPSWGDDS